MKKIIIIGASSGLGALIAADFAAAGWRVGVSARREKPLQILHDEYPDNVVYSSFDATAPDSVEHFNELVKRTGGMDILLFAAGVGFYDPEVNDNKLNNTLQVNVVGFARISAAAYRYFRARNDSPTRGQIAAITSVAGLKGIGVSAAYSASKRFQQTFIDALAQLAYRQHVAIDFTDIRPGFVRTPLLDPDKNYPLIMEAPYAARLIERAVIRRQRVAYIDSRWAAISRFWRMIPNVIWQRIRINF